MRHERHQLHKIRPTLSVVVGGVGQPALSPTATIRRVSDGKHWTGTAWSSPTSSVAMGEVDASSLPGVYAYELPASAVDTILGSSGYDVAMSEITNSVFDLLHIDPTDPTGTGPIEGTARASLPSSTVQAQPGLDAVVPLSVATDPPIRGRAGAVRIDEAFIDVGGTVSPIELEVTFCEMASPTGDASSSVTGVPAFIVAGGPDDEDALSVPVFSSMAFAVGSYVRAAGKAGAGGHVHLVLSKPDGSTLLLHATEGEYDIVDGDTLEEVEATGCYVGFATIPTASLMAASDPSAKLRIAASTVATGGGPVFERRQRVAWSRQIDLDLSSRQFTTG